MSAYNLTIKPAQIEIIAKPGSSITQAYQITNNSPNTLYLTPSVEAWTPQGNDGSVKYCSPACPDAYNAISYSLGNADLKINQSFTLTPNQSQQLVLKIKSTPDASLGDYYATFFISQFTTDKIRNSDPAAPQTSAKLGSHILLSLSKTESNPASSQIKLFKTSPRLKDIFFGKVNFTAQIDNTSDYYYPIVGKINIVKNGKTQTSLDLAPQNVLAHHSRNINCISPDKQSLQTCSLKAPFWPGHYTATLSLNPAIKSTPVTISYYIFPYYLGLALLLLSLAAILFFKRKPSST